jgi:hypothetical protein
MLESWRSILRLFLKTFGPVEELSKVFRERERASSGSWLCDFVKSYSWILRHFSPVREREREILEVCSLLGFMLGDGLFCT